MLKPGEWLYNANETSREHRALVGPEEPKGMGVRWDVTRSFLESGIGRKSGMNPRYAGSADAAAKKRFDEPGFSVQMPQQERGLRATRKERAQALRIDWGKKKNGQG